MNSKPTFIRIRLSAMMFLQFFLWASWYVPLGGYANSELHLSAGQIGWLYATTALAAMVSPLFVGYVADRLFATERVLAALHFLGALCLFAAAGQREFGGLMTALLINAFCFMPTMALTNSIAFRNIDDPNRFSRVAVFGTIGWIVSGLIVDFALGGPSKAIFLLAGAGGLAMAVYSLLALPHTPPKGRDAGGDVLGLGALRMLREPSFLVFAVCALLISIPLSFYFTWGNAFLLETDRPKPTALQTLCQVSEIFVMLVMPWFIGRIGLKNVLVIGMAAWAARYLCFASLSFPLILVGLLVHGFCYCFVFVASFIYADRRAPAGMSASAQSLVAFLIWGVGMFVGTKLAGFTAGLYPPQSIAALRIDGAESRRLDAAPLPDWKTPDRDATLASLLGDTRGDRVSIERAPRSAPAQLTLGAAGGAVPRTTYAKADLLAALNRADADRDGTVTTAEWRAAQAHRWPPIWLWPAALAAVVSALFAMAGSEPKQKPAQG